MTATTPHVPGVYDVIVVGLGGMGSAIAHHLARRGQRVLGLEQFTPGHALGSSHGGSRLVRQAYFEDPAYVPLLLRAYELWDQLGADVGEEVLTRTGGLWLGNPDSRTVRGSLLSAQRWSLPHEVLTAQEITRRFPTMKPGPDVVGLYEEQAGFVGPERTVLAHLQLAGRDGAELRFQEPVQAWTADEGGAGVRVKTTSGTYTAARLVLSPGSWATTVLADLQLPLQVERQVQFWFLPTDDPAGWSPGRAPVWIWEAPNGRQFYGFPSMGGTDEIKVAFFRGGQATTADAVDRVVHPKEVAEIREYLGPRFPTLGPELLRAVTCLYTNTPDENFIVDLHPRYPQVTIAAGFSGHGFKFVPVIGEIVADICLLGSTKWEIGLFAADRVANPGSLSA